MKVVTCSFHAVRACNAGLEAPAIEVIGLTPSTERTAMKTFFVQKVLSMQSVIDMLLVLINN